MVTLSLLNTVTHCLAFKLEFILPTIIIVPQIGYTALQIAMDYGHIKCVEVLTDHGTQTVDVQDEVSGITIHIY